MCEAESIHLELATQDKNCLRNCNLDAEHEDPFENTMEYLGLEIPENHSCR